MAIKPTIFKFNISLSDLNREIYEELNLTVAQHPSETTERMVTRVLAFCLNTGDRLEFCKGISNTEEPDLWRQSLTGEIDSWIEIGEPTFDRVKKTSRQAKETLVYSFNSKSSTWWQLEGSKLSALPATFFQFQWNEIKTLAELIERKVNASVTISGDSIYVATDKGEQEVILCELVG
ncbi:cellulose synthase operon C protein [marine gamma proteobacterium HTCC2143]|jgi:uncharacterized protein YaeQ|uniref:Cellulose synthase operon C protein n=1 Tax=marine gamma proteobacterium HTCC2143 TaxID=247633 RepID=A0YFA4_9GAMM|nr:cellulose synthase operon C protein [marine gamma proteobacterium HTCC2143]